MSEQSNKGIFITPELTHRSELILHLLEHSKKYVVVKGETDSGKTSFLNYISDQNNTGLVIANISVTELTGINDFYKAIIVNDTNDQLQEPEYSQAELNQWLTACQSRQQTPALLIDNIELLSDEVISQLFDLIKRSNQSAALHICLFCRPSFFDRLDEAGLIKTDSDNFHIIELPKFSVKQTEQFIRHNFPEADELDINLFNEDTIDQLHRIAHGLPGRIKALCDQYLNDPANEAESLRTTRTFNFKLPVFRKKLIVLVIIFIAILSIAAATLMKKEKKVVKQSIKLELPSPNKNNFNDVAETELQKEPESVTGKSTTESVDKSGVNVYDSEGRLVPQETELNSVDKVTIAEETAMDEAKIVVKPEPESLNVSESKPVQNKKDIKWLIEQDPEKYVLQLIGAHEQNTINEYLKLFKGNDDKIISFTALNKNREWYVLVYGLFDNRDQAKAAIDELPEKAKLMAPWPRTVKSIKDLLK